MTGPDDLDCSDLDRLGLDELRKLWRERYGRPPSLRSPEILAHLLAWRVQVARHGGLEEPVRRAIRRPGRVRSRPALNPGSRLTRDWKGVSHEVTVEPDGRFRHQGQLYKSLSEVARAIAGSRWNGPRFFGLREGGEE